MAMIFPAAATAQPIGGAAREATTIEEVIVTARRRSENLSEVPITVSALNSEQLMRKQVRTDSDLQAAVPGLTIRQTQGNNSLTYSIRGQSADTFSGSPSAVVSYINEVPLTVMGASSLYDLGSIQVLKGPQGTLFGRNTTGGAVLFSTAKPTNRVEGLLRGRAGNYNLREFEGMVNVPIVDGRVLLRLAGNAVRRDGYIDNIVTGEEHGEIGRSSGRLTVSVMPSERLENTTMYSYARTDGTNTGATYVYSIYTPADEARLGRDLNTSSAFLAGEVAEQRRLGPYKTRHPFDANHVGEEELFTNTTTYQLADNLQLKNILGYTAADTDSEQPALGAPFVTFATRNVDTGEIGNEVEVESFSEEFQVSGNTLGGNLEYIVGVYLQNQTTDTLWPQTYFEGAVTATNHFRIETDTAALYGQGTYHLTTALRVTAGLRYTREEVSIEQLPQADAAGAEDQDETFNEPSWELGLEYDVSDTLFTYLKTRHSFRSGGFNGSAPPVDAGATGGGNKFEEETVQDVEAGLKFAGSVFGRPARLNVAAYKMWIDDVQRIEFPDPPGPVASIAVTANIPELEVQGVELEGSFMPLDWLELGLAGTYTDTEFTDDQITLFGTVFRYGPVANTPETTWNLWAQIGILDDSEIGNVSLRAELYTQDNMYFSNAADSLTPDTNLHSYELVHLRLTWADIFGSRLSGALFGTNVTDEEHFVGGMPLGASLGHNAAAVGEPRMYGAELSYRY